jgi:hypothetical protein
MTDELYSLEPVRPPVDSVGKPRRKNLQWQSKSVAVSWSRRRGIERRWSPILPLFAYRKFFRGLRLARGIDV